jgi:hypothetical protein
MSMVAPKITDFGRIVLNLISYFFTVCKANSAGVDMSFWKRYRQEEGDSIKMNSFSNLASLRTFSESCQGIQG